jgi:hypothetical protein
LRALALAIALAVTSTVDGSHGENHGIHEDRAGVGFNDRNSVTPTFPQ